MAATWRSVILLIVVVLTLYGYRVIAQEATEAPLPEQSEQPDPADFNGGFIEPDTHNEHIDAFTRDSVEYLFINYKMTYNLARVTCKDQFGGRLAWISNTPLANFLSEALSETNMLLDTLWSGGRRYNNNSEWKWIDQGKGEEMITEEIINQMVQTDDVEAFDRNCLGFSREDHDRPQYRPLACSVERGLVCERTKGAKPKNESTHPGWIKLRNRLYKIFYAEIDFDTAVARCPQHDHKASLAVVASYKDAQDLGRYLLIGRPSLENAWIGANWTDDAYKFEKESISLNDQADQHGYPPWRDGKMRKKNGCVLLDRHLSNTTLFVEARCLRGRSYICYKIDETDETSLLVTDVIIGDHGYRLVFNKKTWEDAKDTCKTKWGKYNSKLVEVETLEKVYHVLYVMAENKTAVQHIWVGGKLYPGNKEFVWISDKSTIDKQAIGFVLNSTYSPSVEEGNTCLNMDRENHIKPLAYGTDCMEAQSFICYFAKSDLEQLQKDEFEEQNNSIESGEGGGTTEVTVPPPPPPAVVAATTEGE